MSDLNSDPCMNMISYMRTCYFSSQDSCLIHCTGWNTFREWSSLLSISFTTQYVVSSLVYCISSQSCNENNCFMGFFPSASIYALTISISLCHCQKWLYCYFMVQNKGPKYLILVLTQVSFNYWYLKSQLQSESLGEVFGSILNTCTHFHILLTNLYMTSEGNKWQVLQEQEIQNLNHNSTLNQYPTCLLENPVIWNNHWFA